METVQTSNLMRIYGPAWSVAGKRPNKLEWELIVAIIAAWHHISKAALVEAIQDVRLL